MNNNNYGYSFNEIIVQDNEFIKKGKNNYGIKKINNEIDFYNEITNNNINFKIPRLIDYDNGILKIEYLKNSTILTNIINENNFENYLHLIFDKLKNIHIITKNVSKQIIENDILEEIQNKVKSRFNETNWNTFDEFNKIKSVNGIKIKSIDCYIEKIKSNIFDIINKTNIHEYSLIHGDIHLNNILLNYDDNQMYFIDPRGYFGNTKLFGLKSYDYGKLLFGLSGYSFFDNMNIDYLQINDNGDIKIDFITKFEFIFDTTIFDRISILFALSIWLANNSCFVNINKKITSMMIAYYYCEKYT
uniref:Aminoglycoside phosphotransferase domain-containing protein n=1 Tax=viral metagenome TaxID=1070528 RepID=A0A6C0DLY9_9ZZZZ